MLEQYPQGVLVEEFIVGRDVTVPFLQAASPETSGVLSPVEFEVSISTSSSIARSRPVISQSIHTRRSFTSGHTTAVDGCSSSDSVKPPIPGSRPVDGKILR